LSQIQQKNNLFFVDIKSKNLMKIQSFCLNIGCGDKPKGSSAEEKWINLDWKEGPGVDVVRDIRRGLPFSNNLFNFILLDNVLEHFSSKDAIFIINEIDRVLQVEGIAEIIVPHAKSQGAFQDPTHKSFWVPRSVIYWCQGRSRYGGKFVGITANLIELETNFYGNKETEEFIKFKVQKKSLDI